MWIYNQRTGAIARNNDNPIAIGYAGKGEHKNKPGSHHLRNLGPLPRGIYKINAPIDHRTLGPYAMRLTPAAGNEMFGRSQFLIHGDSISDPGNASEGCIILPKWARERIWDSGDRWLVVV